MGGLREEEEGGLREEVGRLREEGGLREEEGRIKGGGGED